ncbi:uncharacterized protein CELE_Y54G2A.52 [Caenorhabditis elegans]|uniref:Uncharacterized protein n=1 Tax=Caenorhabditis elegans TaxID=6239 RepID=A5A8P7_CAEEL|nr:Uncharacterized protein CELE_Y54G2A.52 [Caenorhabditis elegans]CCD83538.1 Uncharacterized protein CELE_Y54G2A.52 [Caenorhabditis elegans]|eukprot:NP_001122817.1 Uncharacterized protein CELE_Y54G2A.52 [Caenorhabditis elegans]
MLHIFIKFQYVLFRIILFFILIGVCSSFELFASSEKCNDTSGNPLNCPSNFIYYFECCANECCLRTQVVPAVIIAIGAIFMTGFCLVSCVAYCCCGE